MKFVLLAAVKEALSRVCSVCSNDRHLIFLHLIKVVEHGFQVPMPDSSLYLPLIFLCFDACSLQESRLTTEGRCLEIVTTELLEIGRFLQKQFVSMFQATVHALHLLGSFVLSVLSVIALLQTACLFCNPCACTELHQQKHM